jgi:hypothetical protein
MINKFLRIDISDMQVHRVTNTYGEKSLGIVGESESKELLVEIKPDEVVYVEADGSMVLTREDKWQEVKVGRIFRQSDIIETGVKKRREIRRSVYAAHLGSSEDFIRDFEKQIAPFDKLGENLVFLTDGAPWMRLWINERHASATQILDYTHAVEHIALWLEFIEKDKAARRTKIEKYKTMLLEQGVQPVIKSIEQTEVKSTSIEEEQRKVLKYLNNNAYRMNYPGYIAKGLCIGSGAIEAAHRTVVQQRMKRSGQRWTEERAQNMLNLRVVKLSGKWDKVVGLIRSKFFAA